MSSLLRTKAQPNLRYVALDTLCIYLDSSIDAMFQVEARETLFDLGKEIYVNGDRFRKVKVARDYGGATWATGFVNLGGASAEVAKVALLL